MTPLSHICASRQPLERFPRPISPEDYGRTQPGQHCVCIVCALAPTAAPRSVKAGPAASIHSWKKTFDCWMEAFMEVPSPPPPHHTHLSCPQHKWLMRATSVCPPLDPPGGEQGSTVYVTACWYRR
eukprot:365203-Chlamydomonas_euryale.AAC.4